MRNGCARLPEVARGLPVPVSAPTGTPVIGGARLPGFICSRVFGVLTEQKYITCVRWFARPLQVQRFYEYSA